MPDVVDLSTFPELDGLAPDFHEYEANRVSSAAAARRILGAQYWPEDLTRPAPTWLIPGFLQRQALHVISAPKAARKTWLGLATMLCGVYSVPWVDGTPVQPFQSIYIAADSPRWDVRGQLRKLLLGQNLEPQTLTQAGSFILPFGFKFTKAAHVSLLSELIASWDIKALFVDVLLYTYDGLDENDNSDMGALFQTIKFFRDNLGTAVVLLHHHAKDPSIGARGAGTILQAAEHHYELRRKGHHTSIHREKLRGDEEDVWTDLVFALSRTPNGGRLLSQVLPSATPSLLLTILANGPLSRADVVSAAAAAGMSPRWADGELAALRASGQATSTNGVWSLCS